MTTQAFAHVDYNKPWKICKEMRIPEHLTCLLRNLCEGQETTVRTGHGKIDWFKLGKEYIKAVYCHPAYLTSMWSISCEMPGWMNHKLESTGRYINNLRYADDITFMAERGPKEPLDEGERGE